MSRKPRASTRDTTRRRPARRESHPRVAPATGERATTNVTTLTPRRRRRGRAVVGGLVVVLLLVTLLVAGRWVLHSSLLSVHQVTLSGEVHETAQQVLAATHLDAHPAMIDVSEATVRRDLNAFPWIGSVDVIKRWPNSLQVVVHEVSAVAVATDAHRVLRYVSATGRALTAAPAHVDLPTLVTSPAALSARSWPYLGAESAAALVASELPVAFSAQVRQIVVDAAGQVTLQLTTPLKFILGPATNLTAKFVAVASAIAHGTFVAGDVVDVTTPTELSVTGPSTS